MAECIACGSSKFRIVQNRDHYSGEEFQIFECQICGLGKTEFNDFSRLKDYYPRRYYGTNSRRFFPIVEKVIAWFRGRRADYVSKIAKVTPGRILDVGCGRGLTLQNLRRRGWDVWGTEFSEDSSEGARAALGDRLIVTHELESLPVKKNTCDVITLWHVFEHLQDPAGAAKTLKSYLSEDGVIVVEVPNFNSWQSYIARSKWLYLEAPRHLFHFSLKSLVSLFEKQELSVDVAGTSSLEFGVFGMLQSLLNLLPIPANFLFNFIKQKSAKDMGVSIPTYSLSVILSIAGGTLLFPVAVVLEGLAVLFGHGSCLKVIIRHQHSSVHNA